MFLVFCFSFLVFSQSVERENDIKKLLANLRLQTGIQVTKRKEKRAKIDR
jgi:hypothetical protein